jgi:hypothetical protein
MKVSIRYVPATTFPDALFETIVSMDAVAGIENYRIGFCVADRE